MMQKSASQRILSELENLFRTLALESKKTNSHLKSVTEKAIIKLREYKNLNKSITQLKAVLSNDIILRPLILSWSSRNISISLTALNILQKLLNVNCISSDSFMQILISLRTLLTLHKKNFSAHGNIQSNLDINIQIKMCQILIQIPNSSSWTISRPFLQHIVYITLLLCQSEETAVRSTSLAALQQIVTVALEYSVNSVNTTKKSPNKDRECDTEPMFIFECLFHDLCCLASPKLLYLTKTNLLQAAQSYAKENDDEQTNKTSVAINNQFNLHRNQQINGREDEKSNEIDILPANPAANDAHLISDLYGNNNLGTLRLLDCDFVIDYVPILELLETLIANQEYFHFALKNSNGLLHILHHQLCPLICEIIENDENMLTDRNTSFEGMMKIARLIIELLSRHYHYLEIETEQILSVLLRLLEPSNNYPPYAPIIILEILRHILKNSYLLKFFYIKYDMNQNRDKRVFGSLIHALARFLTQTTISKPKYTQKWSPKRLDRKYFSFIKDPKNIPMDPGLQVSLAVLSLISFVEGLAFVCNVSSSPPTSPRAPSDTPKAMDSPVIETTNYPPRYDGIVFEDMENHQDITLDVSKDIARHMVEVVWKPLLAALSHMLSHSVQESQYQQLLSIYQTTARICGRIQLTKPLERLLSSMSEHGLPHPFFNYTFSDLLYKLSRDKDMFAGNNLTNDMNVSSSNLNSVEPKLNNGSASASMHGNISFVQQNDVNSTVPTIKLSIKNVCTIHALVNIAHGLGSILGSAWSVLLETFEKLDYIFHRQNIQLVDIDNNIISPDSHWNDEVNMLDSRLQQLFDSSEYLDDGSLCELLAALGHLSSSSLAGLATTLDKTSSTSSQSSIKRISNTNKNMLSSDDAISVDKVKSFALRKFVQTIEVNIYRLDKIWDHVIAHLHVIMNFKNSTLRHFGIKTLIRIQLKVLTDPGKDNRNRKKPKQKRLIKPYNNGPNKAVSHISATNAVSESKTNDIEKDKLQKRLFSPYLKLFRSKYADTRERVIRAVSELLETAGDKISAGWPTIVELLNYVPSTENHHTVTLTCLKLAFDDVRLISSDFMECLPNFCILGLIKTVGLFGKQTADNNISYSSIGLLWKISDHITLITKSKKNIAVQEQLTEEVADGLQVAIFKQLQVLCVDGRSDVRNCAMQTINSALVAYGDRLSLNSWIRCIDILAILLTDVVVKRTRLNQQQDLEKREELSRREYRAFRKKWNETEKHCIRGGSRICKMFIAKLHGEDKFRSYWAYYLDTIIKLLDLNPSVASTGITCLQEIAQSNDFIYCCSQNGRYWTEIINCYFSMIRNVGHKEYEIITSRSNTLNVAQSYERVDTNYLEQLRLPFADVCDVMMESIAELLDPTKASRKLFMLAQIEQLVNNLDFLISDANLEHNMIHQPLEILDARLVRLKKLLLIYEQLPPLAPSIAKAIIARIASYLVYVSKCCHCYHQYASKMNINKKVFKDDDTPNTVKKLTRLSLSEKSLLRKTEKTMDFVSQRAITLINQFYSIHIPYSLKVECFEIVINGIKSILDPFLCPMSVVANGIKGFEEVCKTGLPQFSAAHKCKNEESEEKDCYKLSSVESLRVWSALGDVVSVAFRLQHDSKKKAVSSSYSYNLDNYNKIDDKNVNNSNKTLQQLVDLKLSILETTMRYILPYGHFAPQTLKKRIVLLLAGNCWSDNNNLSSMSIQRHARLGQACISALFSLCGDTLLDKKQQKYDISLSAMSYQLLIPKIAFILDQYIDDEMSLISSQRPLPIYRQKHIVHILNLLQKLKIHPDLDKIDSYFHLPNKSNTLCKSQLYYSDMLLISGQTKNRAHLFRLYPVLCKLIRVKDDEIKNCLCDVFKTFGHEMGLNNTNNT